MKTKNIYIDSKKQRDLNLAIQLLEGSGISILDCARLIKNALDFKPKKSKLNNVQYCSKIIDSGIRHLHIKDVSIEKGFEDYLKTKTDIRKASFEDIKYLGRRLLRNAKYAKMNFSELSITDCEKWLAETYPTPSQFNKAHTMLHTLFQYALRQEWADRNVVKLVKKRKVIEKEIRALSLPQVKSLIKTSQLSSFNDCQAPLLLSLFAGIRPQELTRLKWQDIDLDESIITIRPTTSKTGGTRHIEMCKALKDSLYKLMKTKLQLESKETLASANLRHFRNNGGDTVAPRNWLKKWKNLRNIAGFKGSWTQDALRHTYASYHAKNFKDLSRLQLNMGHHNLNLLRSRYINLHNISKLDAKHYFSIAC